MIICIENIQKYFLMWPTFTFNVAFKPRNSHDIQFYAVHVSTWNANIKLCKTLRLDFVSATIKSRFSSKEHHHKWKEKSPKHDPNPTSNPNLYLYPLFTFYRHPNSNDNTDSNSNSNQQQKGSQAMTEEMNLYQIIIVNL